MIFGEKNVSFIAPLIGGLTVYSSLQLDTSGDHWQDVWRVGMSVGLGIFVTLVGMIYRGIDSRIKDLEKVTNDKFVTIREHDQRHAELMARFDDLVVRFSHLENRLDKAQ